VGYQLEKRQVHSIEQIGEKVFVLRFDYKSDFLPGQMVAVSTSLDIPARLYSICSAPNDNQLAIFFNEVEGGQLTPRLSELLAGDVLMVSEPFGKFIGTEDKAFWIATGTGIAPFLSMFLAGQNQNKVLIQGSRKIREFWFQDVFESLGQNYIRCCTQEEGKNIYNGRLTNYLREYNELPKDHKYYLCGSAEMVVQTRDILIAKSIPFENIISEIYF
jgi:ferredoxin--NADP+ reductase